jgi:hypothetical protein
VAPIRRPPFLTAGVAALALAPLVAMASSGALTPAALPVAALLGAALVAAGAYFAAAASRLLGERRSGLAAGGTPAAVGC